MNVTCSAWSRRGHVSATRGVEKHRESEGRLIYLTEEQVERVIACAGVARWKKLPALIRLAFTSGLRLGALKGLRWRDVDVPADVMHSDVDAVFQAARADRFIALG